MNAKKLLQIWVLALLVCSNYKVSAQPNYPQNWQEAKIIYSDLYHFVNALEAMKTDQDTLSVLNKLYFEKASTGLKEYIRRHGLTPEMLKEAIRKYPDRYHDISGFLTNKEVLENDLKRVFQEFEEVVPKAVFAPTYLLVGANRGIAQASLQGQLVTITRVLDDHEKLMKLIVHELAHFQQAMTLGGQEYVGLYSQPDNMLGLCLREGGAEYITYLVLNDVTQSKTLTYLNDHESDLKQKFKEDLKKQDKTFWLWESVGHKDIPQLLGYSMGFKVWESLYKQTGDQSLVIDEILEIRDSYKAMTESRYFESLD